MQAYTGKRALALSLFILPFLAWHYLQDGLPQSRESRDLPTPSRDLYIGLSLLVALLWALMLVPVFLWPRSSLGSFMHGTIAWDVVYYHLPKAVNLIQEGHFWNLAIPYGQYPVGWESLLALSISINGNAEGLGPATGIALVGFYLSWYVLLQRETAWPGPVVALLVGIMTFSFYLPVPNNPWREFARVMHYTSGIGKNDLLSAALVLSALVHLPLSSRHMERQAHPTGLALSLAAALAVKPHAGLSVLGLIVIAKIIVKSRFRWSSKLFCLITASLGVSWLIRNLVILKRPFSPIASILAHKSIFYALPQAIFWHSHPKTWWLVSAMLLFSTLLVLLKAYSHWRGPLAAAWVLYVIFLVTPASVRLHGTQMRVAWRFGLALLAWIWTLAWAFVAHGIPRIPDQFFQSWPISSNWRFFLRRMGLWLSLLATAALFWRYGERLSLQPQHAWILYDPFPQPVGTLGYHSVFDFIHRRVRQAVIDFDGAPPWYVYDPELTNRAVRPGHYPGGMPTAVSQPKPTHWLFCAAKWQPHGKVEDPLQVVQQVVQWRSQGLQILYIDQACALARQGPNP